MAKPRLKLKPQWNCLDLEKGFSSGEDLGALLQAIDMAFTAGAPVPSWAVDAFRKAFIEGYLGNLKSWDDVFGRPPTKEELRRFNRDLGARGKIWQMIANARQQGRGITNDLFEEIGRKVGINKTDVGRLYKEQCRFLGTPEKP